VYVTSVKCRLAVMASGRGSNFRALAERCQDPTFPAEVVCLVTDDRTAQAVAIAEAFGIPWHAVEPGERRGHLKEGAETDVVRRFDSDRVDLIVLAGFMRILHDDLLARYAGRIINIHPSLLPSFKGLYAQRQALEYGVKIAGCTVHFVDASIDGGPIILQAAVPVHDGDDLDALRDRILAEEHRILCEAVALFARGALRVEGRRVLGTRA
jgi:phosphoribosylglycinamide formyltransferase-1